MKIEIELSDLETLWCADPEYDELNLNSKDLKQILVNTAIEKFIDNLYDDYMNDTVYTAIKDDAREVVRARSNEIVDKVVDKVAAEILKKKSIVEEMPKKSEVANISKEWENYFIELIDKAIAKRFK
jgi:hypothetical protein